jgi:RNA polymerase sigma-70 factor (ECF subfamily)
LFVRPFARLYSDAPSTVAGKQNSAKTWFCATPAASREYQGQEMDEDVQSLLQKHRFRQAFERLLDLYEVKVFRMAVMFLRDRGRAEEITQDIFLKLWQVLPAYDGRAAPSTWLYTIARNTCLSALRSEGHRKTLPYDSITEPATAERIGGSTVLNKIALERCLARLPGRQRDVITLFYLQDKSVEEVARMLDLPEGTVKSDLHRARLALAAMIKE